MSVIFQRKRSRVIYKDFLTDAAACGPAAGGRAENRLRSVLQKKPADRRFRLRADFRAKEKTQTSCQHLSFQVEAPSRLELENEAFAELCLTTWLWRRIWSGRRDSDSRHPPWQGGTLPLSYYRTHGALGRNRTTDTQIFSLLLYRLSYQGK